MAAIEINRNGTELRASYRNASGQPSSVGISEFLVLDDSDRESFLTPICRYIERVSARSAVNYLRAASELGRTLRRLAIKKLPQDEAAWQRLVVKIHEDTLLNTDTTASLKTRATILLPTLNTFLTHLQDEGVIPPGVTIPSTPHSYSRTIRTTPSALVIGEKIPESVRHQRVKLLCSVSLSRTDAEYLDDIYEELVTRRATLRKALLTYFRTMRAHIAYGEAAIAAIDEKDVRARLQAHLEACERRSRFDRNSVAFCKLDSEEHLAEYLLVCKRRYGYLPTESESRDDKSVPMSLPFDLPIPEELRLPLSSARALGDDAISLTRIQLRWMLGRISVNDIAVMSALLIMEHPEFTPEAVTKARLIDRKGHRTVEFGDRGPSFYVTKHRARSIKKATLTDVAHEIIELASSLTPEIRSQLKEDNSPIADALFIPCSIIDAGHSNFRHEVAVSFLSGCQMSRTWLGKFAPELEERGLDRGTISFTKIRCTEGVLEWFRSGSIRNMARRLGNTSQTCIDHYLPPSLLKSWNVRLIRRFQNMWITVAAANEDWLLPVTDFATLEELHAFINDILTVHSRFSSPLAAELHSRLGATEEFAVENQTSDAWLSVSISKNSLAALYLYHEAYVNSPLPKEKLDLKDRLTGKSPRQFVDLALLLRHMLPNESDPDRRLAHEQALVIVDSMKPKITWDRFFRA